MNTDIETWIGAEIERSFGSEPALREPRSYAERGRRTQRRRRAAIGALGLAGAAVATTLVLGGSHLGADADRGVEPADGGGTPLRVTTPVPVDARQSEKCAAGLLGKCGDAIDTDDIHLDPTGRLLRGYSYDVVSGYYRDVLPHTPDPDVTLDTSAAVELTVRGTTVWALLRLDTGGRTSSLQFAPPDATRTFDEWVADSARSGRWFSYRPDPDGPGEGATPR
jgi:hypothetical protein